MDKSVEVNRNVSRSSDRRHENFIFFGLAALSVPILLIFAGGRLLLDSFSQNSPVSRIFQAKKTKIITQGVSVKN